MKYIKPLLEETVHFVCMHLAKCIDKVKIFPLIHQSKCVYLLRHTQGNCTYFPQSEKKSNKNTNGDRDQKRLPNKGKPFSSGLNVDPEQGNDG